MKSFVIGYTTLPNFKEWDEILEKRIKIFYTFGKVPCSSFRMRKMNPDEGYHGWIIWVFHWHVRFGWKRLDRVVHWSRWRE
jgi:hypothetical protein